MSAEPTQTTPETSQDQPQQSASQQCQMPEVYPYKMGCPDDCALCTAVPVKDDQGNVNLVCIPNVQQNDDGTYTVNDTCGKPLVTIDVDGTVKPNEDNPLAQQFVQKLMEVAKQEQMTQPQCQPSCPDWYICPANEEQEQEQKECQCDEGYTKVKVTMPHGTAEICVKEDQVEQKDDGTIVLKDTCGNPVIQIDAEGNVSVAPDAKDAQLASNCYQQLFIGVNKWLNIQEGKGYPGARAGTGMGVGTGAGAGMGAGTTAGQTAEAGQAGMGVTQTSTDAVVEKIVQGITQIIREASGNPNVQVQIDAGKIAEAIAEALTKIEEVRVQAQVEMKKMEMEQRRLQQEYQRGQQGQQMGQSGKGKETGEERREEAKERIMEQLKEIVKAPDKDCRCGDDYVRVEVIDEEGNRKYICLKKDNSVEVRHGRHVIFVEDEDGAYKAVAEIYEDGAVDAPSVRDVMRLGIDMANSDVIAEAVQYIYKVADDSECKPGGGFFPLFGWQRVQPAGRTAEERKEEPKPLTKEAVEKYKKAFEDLKDILGLK